MIKTVRLEDSIGAKLAHDMTEIRPGQFKGAAFRKGHTVCEEDICRLQKMGKHNLYLLELEQDEIHEDEAALILATSLAGDGVTWEGNPVEGKIRMIAAHDGLLKVEVAALAAFNMVDEVMCATLHCNTVVKKGELIAATRAIPLVMPRGPIERAAAIAGHGGGVISVLPLRKPKPGIVITGNEVYHGLIQDRFAPVLREKFMAYQCPAPEVVFSPDDPSEIASAITGHLEAGCGLILLTGGMSVDPDDVTRQGIKMAGASEMHYGSAVLPGAMFLMAYLEEVPILGVPACGLYHRATILDLILPRVLAGERIAKKDLALLGHGGLCRDCKECIFPKCAFGK